MQQRRGATRHKLFEPVMMEGEGQPFRAHLLDLSCSGALAHAEMPPLPSARLIVSLMGIAMPARVMWVRTKRFGMQFELAIPQATIDRLLGAGTVIAPEISRRPSPVVPARSRV